MTAPRELLDGFQTDINLQQVFVFTPQAAVKSLPDGSTPIDFAYAIHTDIGDDYVCLDVAGDMIDLVRKNIKTCRVGFMYAITDAQDQMGDIVFINLPEVGDEVEAGEVFGDVESVKAVFDLFSPVTGKVAEINEDVLNSPGLINEDPYENWLIKVEEITDKSELLDRKAIEQLIEEEAN